MAKSKSTQTDTDDVIKRKPNDNDWARVTSLYFQGKTYKEIIKLMPLVALSEQKLARYITKYSLNTKKHDMDIRVIDAALAQAEDAKKQVNSNCITLFNKGAKVIDDLLNNCQSELAEGTYTKGQARATAYNVNLLMEGVTKVQRGLRVAYGMDKDGNLYEKEPEVLTIEGMDIEKI